MLVRVKPKKSHKKVLVALAVSILTVSQSAYAQDNCLQRRVGASRTPGVSHWIVTNVCGYTVQFKAYMAGTGGQYQVYTTELGKLVDPNPGFPITVTLESGRNQSFYFGAPSMMAGQWAFITENVRQAK